MSNRKGKRLIGLRIDIESRSRVEIKFGPYKYCEDPDFAVLVIAYSPIYRFPGGATKLGQPRLLDLSDDPHNPREHSTSAFVTIIRDPRFQKHAFNANFERIALSKWLGMPNGTYLDPENWRCSAILANTQGVFGSLDEVARATRSPIKKDAEGKRLIKLFSKPETRKTSPVYGQFHDGFAHLCGCGSDHRADMRRFESYCCNDVLTEAMATAEWPGLDDVLQAEYEMDQRINDRGFRHFKGLSLAAVEQVKVERDRLMGELKVLTGLDNPNSIQQFQGWLDSRGYPMASLDKDHREEALLDKLIPEDVAEALRLKGAASLSSVSKHQAALDRRCEDGRVRGALRYYGAHTGREAGNGMQPQNLPRYEAPPEHRKALLLDTLHALSGVSVAEVAKGTVRASIVPARGHVFVTADYNAIEARVLAGLAGERWAQAEFAGQGKIYEATSEQMGFMDKTQLLAGLKACDKCGSLACIYCEIRGRGKVSNLALGYNGGAGALVTMGAEEAGIDIGNYKELHAEWTVLGKPGGKFWEWRRDEHDYPELIRLRDLYRAASPATVGFWKQCARAWDVAAIQGKTARFGDGRTLTMMRDGRHNRLVLPSGRSIWYRFARSAVSDTNPDRIERRSFIGKSSGVGHVRTDTHGGKLTENVTQAVARDVLFDLLTRIEAMSAKGWPARTVLHVHDEVVLEVPTKHADQVLADTIGLMAQAPSWGDFLIVKGEGKIMERYRK